MLSWPDFQYKQLIIYQVKTAGEKIRFRADNIVIVNDDDQVLLQHSCHRLFALIIIGDISLTSVLLKNSAKYGFPIILLGNNLHIITRINSMAEGNTVLRMRQYAAGERNLIIAKKLIRQKLDNQISLLKGIRRLAVVDKIALEYLQSINLDAAKGNYELMGLEGNASHVFFSAYFRPLGWVRREPRCKRDIYNLLLDIGYTYMFHYIEAMLCLYGFDTYCGVLHTLFYHRKSLVCDIVEPFRCIIDLRLRKAYNLGQIDSSDFEFKDKVWRLPWQNQAKYTRLFLKDILSHKEEIFKFCRDYYRWFMRDDAAIDFPCFKIKE